MPLLPAPEGGADGVCLSTGFSPSLHGFAMSCPRAPCVKARPLAEVGPRLGRARTVGLDVSAMVPRTWTPQQMECAARMDGPAGAIGGRVLA